MSAKEFFLTELPPLIAEIQTRFSATMPKLTYDVEFEIQGEGMYAVNVKEGQATVRRGGAANPLVSMSFSLATFERSLSTFIRPAFKRLTNHDPKDVQTLGQKELSRQLMGRRPVSPEQAVNVVRSLPLRVVLEVEPKAHHHFELKLAGAEEDDPTVTVFAKEADIDAMLAGHTTVEQAFKEQKLRMKGAVPTVMALLARLFVPK